MNYADGGELSPDPQDPRDFFVRFFFERSLVTLPFRDARTDCSADDITQRAQNGSEKAEAERGEEAGLREREDTGEERGDGSGAAAEDTGEEGSVGGSPRRTQKGEPRPKRNGVTGEGSGVGGTSGGRRGGDEGGWSRGDGRVERKRRADRRAEEGERLAARFFFYAAAAKDGGKREDRRERERGARRRRESAVPRGGEREKNRTKNEKKDALPLRATGALLIDR